MAVHLPGCHVPQPYGRQEGDDDQTAGLSLPQVERGPGGRRAAQLEMFFESLSQFEHSDLSFFDV